MTELEDDKDTSARTTFLRGFDGVIPEEEIEMQHVR